MPKALRLLDGRPLVTRSAEALVAGGCTALVVVVAAELRDRFEQALAGLAVPVVLVAGGERRQDSVRAGLEALGADPWLDTCRVVLVHDAARALVPPEVVTAVIGAVDRGADAVIPVVPMIDSVRRDHSAAARPDDLPARGSSIVDRSDLRLVQTPQGFHRHVLVASHAHVAEQGLDVTDDAAVCEATGHEVVLVPGSRESLKVTEPFDLLVAEAICASRRAGAAS